MTAPLVIAMSQGKEIALLPQMANRHGLITGATGTGKTVTLQKMAESFASIGVLVFMADVKGDLSGIGAAGVSSEKLLKRLEGIGHQGIQATLQHNSILGRVRQIRSSGACDSFRYGPPASGASAKPE